MDMAILLGNPNLLLEEDFPGRYVISVWLPGTCYCFKYGIIAVDMQPHPELDYALMCSKQF